MADFFEFKYKNKFYKIRKEAVFALFSALEGKRICIKNNYEIIKLFKKYHLNDKLFLIKISKL